MRWSTKENIFFLTHPPFAQETHLQTFLEQHQWWIQKTIQKISSPLHIGIGDSFSFLENVWQLAYDPLRKKGVWRQGYTLCIGAGVSDPNQSIETILKKEAQAFFEVLSQHYADQLNVRFERIAIRDGHSRWGSCSSSGTLSYSWRLGFAPLEIARYVCAHEVAHLREMNHSPRFWALVEKLDPLYKKHRTWLKKEGSKLKTLSFAALPAKELR